METESAAIYPSTEEASSTEEAPPTSLLERILVPVDFSMASHRAVEVALELRRLASSTVCLFHLAQSDTTFDFLGGIGSPAVGGDWVAETEERLQRFITNIAAPDRDRIEVRAAVGGDLGTGLRAEATRWGATLVVASADIHAKLFRSPAERLVRTLAMPILVIPADADEES